MANEISYTVQTSLSNNGLTDNFSSGAKAVDQTNRRMVRNVQEIGTGTTGESLELGDLIDVGVAVFNNLDDTNFVEVGQQVSGAFEALIKLKPGEVFLFRLTSGLAPYARADTGLVELDYRIYDD
jgi:hypothetical protein